MPVDRMRMRPWLELKLNSGSDPCLSWIDKEKGIFMVSWRHASRSGWNESTDASIFREWAIHTGKFREDHVDPKTWKANFRCALHSLCDVRERRDLSTRRGGQAARVYVMLAPRTPKKTSKMKYRNRRRESPELLTPASATFCSSPGGEDSARSDALGFRLQISASYTVLQGGGAEPEVASDDDVIELVDHLRQLHETAWEPRLVPWSAPY